MISVDSKILVLISTAMIGTLDSILTSKAKGTLDSNTDL